MKTEQTNFNKTVSYLGRNGIGLQTGISIVEMPGNILRLYPVNSKRVLARGFMDMSQEDIASLVAALQQFQSGDDQTFSISVVWTAEDVLIQA